MVIRPAAQHLGWRRLLVAVYVGLNIGLFLIDPPFDNHDADWEAWRAVADGLASGTLYDLGTAIPYAWSPVFAPVVVVVAWLGPVVTGLAFGAMVLLVRNPLLIWLTFVSFGFWTALAGGNAFLFAFVAGALALAGSRSAALVYLALLFLMPRPVQIPLAVWLLVKYPDVRLPAIGIFTVHAALVLASGYGPQWIETMASIGSPAWDKGPTRWLGLWWLVIGLPLGAWLTRKGYVGWAGVVISTYTVPHNLLMPLVELNRSAMETPPPGQALE